MLIIGIILIVFIFIFLILIHEFGHFIAAKKSGVKVHEFGLGIPPKILTLYKDKDGTEYTLNAIPLGGFVRLQGENPEDEKDFFAPDSFMSQKLRKRLIILGGGVFMNLLFGLLILITVFMIGIKPIITIPDNAIAIKSESYLFPSESFAIEKGIIEKSFSSKKIHLIEVITGTLANKIGLIEGDTIESINGQTVNSSNISDILFGLAGKEFEISYQRNNELLSGKIQCPEDNCLLGVVYDGNETTINGVKYGFWEAIGASIHEIKAQTQLTFFALGNIGKSIASGNKEKIKQSVDKLSGPALAGKIWYEIFKQSFVQFLAFGAMISIALAIFNFLPIPALDGGRALSMIIQALLKLNPEKYFKVENYINLAFFLLLMIFGIYILLLDLVRGYNIPIPRIS